MKYKLLHFSILLHAFIFSHAQGFCMTDEIQRELEMKDPFVAQARQEAEKKLIATDIRKFLNSKSAYANINGKYTGPIYTIPVVVHIIVPNNDAIGTTFNPSDNQVKQWIENTNKVFATIYGGTFPYEGPGNNDGTVIPFKLALAQRTKDCVATTGIIRYDGSTLPDYANNGVGSNGVTVNDITAFAPHWPESFYYNVYIVDTKLSFASLPTNPDSSFHAFMKADLVTRTDEFAVSIMPHEVAHSLGLMHTFGSDETVCPANNDCTIDNDKVCDTSPNKAYQLYPLPNNTMINPCTNALYDGIQYNMMSYCSPRKFTPGQRDRMLVQFLTNRLSLTQSLGSTDLITPGIPSPLVAACTIPNSGINANLGQGPALVKLGSINNSSTVRNSSNPVYYIDYSTENCINPSVYTNLTVGQSYDLEVGIKGNPQYIQAWIDYNNNGSFETSEMIASSGTKVPTPNGFSVNAIWNATIIPPATAVLNTPLRFRVRASGETGACTTPNYGQIEDYTVILNPMTTLSSEKQQDIDKFNMVYSKNGNKLISNELINNYKIYDIYGRLVQQGSVNSKEINLDFNQSGTYIIVTNMHSTKFNK